VTEFAPGLHARAGVEVDASAYERFTGRWSRLFVSSVIAAAGVRSGGMVLDIATGTGEAAVALLPVIGPCGAVVGVDISPEMVQSAVRRVSDTRFLPIAADGQELPFRSGSFDALVCQLGLQFFRSRRAASPSSGACCARVAKHPYVSFHTPIGHQSGVFSLKRSHVLYPKCVMSF